MGQQLPEGDVSDDDNPDADLLAFNVEMGMIPMSSVNSSGGLVTAEVDAPRRRARLNSHSVPLAGEPADAGREDEEGAPMQVVQKTASKDSASGGGAITSTGALFDYFTSGGSQDSWDNAPAEGAVSASNSASNVAGAQASSRRRNSGKGLHEDNVIHKYVSLQRVDCCVLYTD